MTLAVPRRTNIPRPTKKDPKDTLERAFNKLAWGFFPDGASTSTTVIQVIPSFGTFLLQEVAEFCLFNEDFGKKQMWSCRILSLLLISFNLSF